MKVNQSSKWENTRALAGGKTWAELEELAKKAKTTNLKIEPDILLGMLRSYAKLYEDTASLRRMELFGQADMKPKTQRGV